jgi:hypothetical protein
LQEHSFVILGAVEGLEKNWILLGALVSQKLQEREWGHEVQI